MTMNITKKMIEKKCREWDIDPRYYYIHIVSGDGQLGKDWAKDGIECNWPDKDSSALIYSDPIKRIEEIGWEDPFAEIVYWADGNPACFLSSEEFFDKVYRFAMEGWLELDGDDLKEAISRVEELDEEVAKTGGPWRAIGTKEGSYNNKTLKEVIVFW